MSTWRVTPHGLATVARLELRQRVRSSRWLVVLGVWVAVLALFTWLTDLAVGPGTETAGGVADPTGGVMFSVIAFLVLSLGVLVAPALSATSVNGDRAAGTLATLQVTLLSPAEIALGKLLAAWGAALAFLLAAAPFIGWAYVSGGTPFGRVVSTLTLLAVILAVVCAIGLGWSAVCARTASSAVLTYLSVAFLCLGTVILFGLSVPLVTGEERARVLQLEGTFDEAPTREDCVERVEQISVTHTERTWWLLAASPYVVLADAAPGPYLGPDVFTFDPLSAIRTGVRSAKAGPPEVRDWCGVDGGTADRQRLEDAGAAWPYGLGVDLLLGGAAVVAAVRRLRTPMRALPRGTRVA